MSPRILLLLVGIHVASPEGQSKDWQSADGRQLQGSFIRLSGDIVTLKAANGQPLAVPLSALALSASPAPNAADSETPPLHLQTHRRLIAGTHCSTARSGVATH